MPSDCISQLIHLWVSSPLSVSPFCSHHRTANAMNSTLTTISFQSPPIKLQPSPRQRLTPPRQQEIGGKWGARTGKPDLLPKPIQATLGPNSTGNTLPSSPMSDLIQEFYSSLNNKDRKRLEKLIAPDCFIEDTAYYEPLDIKNTHTYFRRLMEAMGNNVKFAIDEVSQGVEPTVAVMWHLEWNGKIIPFTKGCSFYVCSGSGAALLVRKVHIFDESPLKPGKLALEMLNIVTSLFDTFPNIAEGFLKNPEALVQAFVRVHRLYVEPFILPLLAYYTHFWTYVAQGLNWALKVLYKIFKRFV